MRCRVHCTALYSIVLDWLLFGPSTVVSCCGQRQLKLYLPYRSLLHCTRGSGSTCLRSSSFSVRVDPVSVSLYRMVSPLIVLNHHFRVWKLFMCSLIEFWERESNRINRVTVLYIPFLLILPLRQLMVIGAALQLHHCTVHTVPLYTALFALIYSYRSSISLPDLFSPPHFTQSPLSKSFVFYCIVLYCM